MNAQWTALIESGGWVYLLPFVALIAMAVGYIRSIHVPRPLPSSPWARIVFADELVEGMTVLLDCTGSGCRYAGAHNPAVVHPLTITRMRLSGATRHLVLSDLSGVEHDMGPLLSAGTVRVAGGPVQTVSLDLSGTCLPDRDDLSADLSARPVH